MSMQLSDVVAAFTDNGVPFAFQQFEDGTRRPPYADKYERRRVDGFASDNDCDALLMEYDVVLWQDDVDLDLEHAIEADLRAASITFDKHGWTNRDRKLEETHYVFQVLER